MVHNLCWSQIVDIHNLSHDNKKISAFFVHDCVFIYFTRNALVKRYTVQYTARPSSLRRFAIFYSN